MKSKYIIVYIPAQKKTHTLSHNNPTITDNDQYLKETIYSRQPSPYSPSEEQDKQRGVECRLESLPP